MGACLHALFPIKCLLMISNLPVFIGLRYTRGKQRNGFISFISLLSFIAMTLGITVLIVVLSVMNGFDREIKTRILNVVPHLSIFHQQGLEDWKKIAAEIVTRKEITAVSPYIEGMGLLSTATANQGVLVKGIEPVQEQHVTSIDKAVVAGNLAALRAGEFGVVVGSLLARTLNVVVGDSVVLSLPQLNLTPAGAFPRYKRLRVVAIFQVGAQTDNGLALIHLDDAKKLYRTAGRVDGLHARSTDPFAIDSHQLAESIGQDLRVTAWSDSLASLFQAIKMEKTVVGTLLSVIIAVAAFNIIASLVLMVGEKRKDMAVLRTLGAPPSTVAKIFIVQGCVIGIAGVLLGSLSGCTLSLYIGDIFQWLERLLSFQLFDPSVYFISELPSLLKPTDVLIVSSIGIFLSFMATLYPARRAGKILPAEALRYDH